MKFHERHVDVHASSTWADNITRKHNLKKEPTEADMGEIAICVNCAETWCSGSCDTIIKYRRENKSDQNERCIRAKKIPNDFEDRVNAGIGTAELAKLYRVGTSTVYRWKKKLGLVNTNLGRKSKQHGV